MKIIWQRFMNYENIKLQSIFDEKYLNSDKYNNLLYKWWKLIVELIQKTFQQIKFYDKPSNYY